MQTLPVLQTERLLLRVPCVADAEAMADFVVRNREHLAPSEPLHHEAYFTAEFWARELQSLSERVLREEVVPLILLGLNQPSSPMLGRCTLSALTRGPFQAAYLGYGLDAAQVGKGLMHEALRAVIDFAFGSLNLHRIMANHEPTNERSARVLERLGFEREGYARKYLRLGGQWKDHVLTALTNPAWASPADGLP